MSYNARSNQNYGNRVSSSYLSSVKNLNNLPDPDDDTVQIIDKYFSRKYSYKNFHPTELWTLPENDEIIFTSNFRWNDEELQELKGKLNHVKERLSEFDIKQWQEHTCARHQGSEILKFVRRCYRPEMCTQAWCKFYEIVGTFPDIAVPPKAKNSCVVVEEAEFVSVHLCEAPGAFISSLNHFRICKGFTSSKWQWLASTLNPYYEGNSLSAMIDDDRFIRSTLSHWYFGQDDTGDLMNDDNMINLKGELHNELGLKKIHLVTADGSIDCANEPAEQEAAVSQLHFCETVKAIDLLCIGGSFVLKMFTMFEDTSICLVYLLCCIFNHVDAIKPVSSKPGNSEVYLVCRSFVGIRPSLLEKLKQFVGPQSPSGAMFPRQDIPESFLQWHRSCCRRFADFQTETIVSNIDTYRSSSRQSDHFKSYFVKKYVDKFSLTSIRNSERIVPECEEEPIYKPAYNNTSATPSGEKLFKKRHDGTYNERQRVLQLSWIEKVNQMKKLNINDIERTSSRNTADLFKSQENLLCYVVRGKPFAEVHSSKFCDKHLLIVYQEFLRNVQKVAAATLVETRSPEDLIRELIVCITPDIDIKSVLSINEFTANERSQLPVESALTTLIYRLTSSMNIGITGHCSRLDREDFVHLLDDLQVLPIGSNYAYSSRVLLARLSVSLLFIVCSCFEKVRVFKDGSSPVLRIFCHDYGGGTRTFMEQLVVARNEMEADREDRMQILSVIPIEALCESNFLSFVCKINDDYLKLRINHLLDVERALIADHIVPRDARDGGALEICCTL